jgi:hypothetical protein
MPPHPTQTAALDEEQKWANSFEVTLAVHARTIKMMPPTIASAATTRPYQTVVRGVTRA